MPQTLTLEEFNARYAPKTLTLEEMGARESGSAPAPRTFEPPSFEIQEAVGKAFKDLYEGAIVAPARNLYGGFKLGAAGASQLSANAMMLINRAGDYLTEKTGVGAMSKDTAFGEVEKWLRENARQLTGQAEPYLDDNIIAQIYQGLGQAPAAIAEYGSGARLLGPVAGFAAVDALQAADQGPEEAAYAAVKGALIGGMFKGAGPLTRPARTGALATIGGTQAAVEGGDVKDVTAGAATLGILGAMGPRGRFGLRDLYAKPRQLTIDEMNEREFTGQTIREPGAMPTAPGRPAERGVPFKRPQAQPAILPSDIPRTVFRGSGRTEQGEAYSGPAVPILGPGRYYAFSREAAEKFGPEVKQAEFAPKNPLVIRSDEEWKALTKEAGWKFPNPFGLEEAQIRQQTNRLQEIARQRGHDAVVVIWDDTTRTDIDRHGNKVKTLRNVFGQPQALLFDGGRPTPEAPPVPAVKARGRLSWDELPTSVQAAVAAFRREGERGVNWQFDYGGGRASMEALNRLLVERKHPLAKHPGTDEGRFRRVVSELAKEREDIKNLDQRTGEEAVAVEPAAAPLPPAVFRSEAEGRADLPPAAGKPKPLRIPPEAGIGIPETTEVRGPDGSIRVEIVRKPPAETGLLGEIKFKSTKRSTESYLDEAARRRTARTLTKDQKVLAEEARKSNLAAFDAAHQELVRRTYAGTEGGVEAVGVKIETITARDKRTTFRFPATEEGVEELLATKKRYEKLPAQTTGYGMRLPEGVRAAETQGEAGEKYVAFRRQVYDPDQEPLPKHKRPLTREAVIAPLLEDLGVPVYQGRVKGERLGFFRPSIEEVRIKRYGDLEVTAHELAHLLDKRFPEIRKQWLPATKANKAIREELRGVSYDKKKLFEGYAEFMRLWSTQPQEAQVRAPRFYDWFEGFLDRNRHGPAIRQSKDRMLAWFEQAALDRARSKIGQQETINEVVKASVGRRFRQGALDDLYGILNAEMSLYGTYNGPTYQSARLTRGSSGIVQAALQYGVPRWSSKYAGEKPGRRSPFARIELLDGAGEPINLLTEKGRVIANPKAQPWGLERILEPIVDDLDAGLLYFVGKRADFLRRQGRERLFSAAEIKSMLALETPARAKTFEDWNRFNSQLLDFAEQSGLIDPQGRRAWESGVYLPFWRVGQDSPGTSLAEGIPGFTKIIKRLRGGTQNIRNPLENMFQNTRMLIESSINNEARREVVDMIMAAEGTGAERPGGARFLTKIPKENRRVRVLTEAMRNAVKEHFARDQSKQVAAVERTRRGQEEPEIVEAKLDKAEKAIKAFEELADEMFDNLAFTATLNGIVPGQSPHGPTVIAVMSRGKPTFYEVADPQLFLSLTSMPRVTQNAVMKFLMLPRRIGQATITLSWEFMLRNITRDYAMSAVMTEVGGNQFKKAVRGYKSRITRDPAYREWIANGGAISSFWSQEGQFETHLKSYYEKHGIVYNTVINTPRKFLHFMERFADAFEAANRIGEFQRALEKGKTPREGAFQSREISTDFAMRGDPRQSVLVRGDTAALAFFYNTVLFLKAGAVGVDRVYRGFRYQGNKMTVAIKTGMIALASIALHAYNAIENADEYDALEEWDKDAHWHIWIPFPGGKEHFRIPKPWEIGGIATISERAFQGVVEQDPSQIGKSLRVVREMFRYDMIPFFIEPVAEQMANRHFYLDRPIESESLKGVPPWMRASPYTSRTMKALGEATSKLPEALGGGLGGGLSPARMEHLLRGYFNAWALYGLTLSDQLFFDEAASLRADEVPGLRAIYRQTPARSTRYRTIFYDMLHDAIELRRGMHKMDREYRPEIAALMEKTPENLEYNQLTAVNENVQAINAEMNHILATRTLPQLHEIANELGKEKQFATPVGRLRLSKNWRDMGLLKRELRDLWLSERNALFKEAVKDIEAQRADPLGTIVIRPGPKYRQ